MNQRTRKKVIGKMDPIIEPILYRKQITVFGATQYTGKSRFCHLLCHKLANGKETMFGQVKPLKILYCSEIGDE